MLWCSASVLIRTGGGLLEQQTQTARIPRSTYNLQRYEYTRSILTDGRDVEGPVGNIQVGVVNVVLRGPVDSPEHKVRGEEHLVRDEAASRQEPGARRSHWVLRVVS